MSLSLILGACAPAPAADGRFPIIGSDADRLVEVMRWDLNASDAPDSDDFEEPLVLESSTPEELRIAVKGGGCPPSAQVVVTGSTESVVIAMNLGGTIEPPDVSCEAVISTHVMVIQLVAPIDLSGLVVTSVRTGVNNDDGS